MTTEYYILYNKKIDKYGYVDLFDIRPVAGYLGPHLLKEGERDYRYVTNHESYDIDMNGFELRKVRLEFID